MHACDEINLINCHYIGTATSVILSVATFIIDSDAMTDNQ